MALDVEFTIPFRSTYRRPTAVWATSEELSRLLSGALSEMVSLPMFPELTPAQVEMVAQCIKEAVSVCTLA